MNFICLNGKILPDQQPVLMAANRSFRYGDGLFETIKVVNGRVCLSALHFERLIKGARLLEWTVPEHFTEEYFASVILELCEKNGTAAYSRVRFSAFGGDGMLDDDERDLQFLVETRLLDKPMNELAGPGICIDIYPAARKSADAFSNLKTANALPYLLAANYARKNGFDDCLVLNQNSHLIESSISNLFVVSGNQIFTPPLSDGCVTGVMRSHIINSITGLDAAVSVEQKSLKIEDLLNANEIFLSNAVSGIRWVSSFRGRVYGNTIASVIYSQLVRTIWI
jgi:branched-chain amino acid aminotransferase